MYDTFNDSNFGQPNDLTSPTKKPEERKAQNVVPFFVRMITDDIEDEDFTYFGQPVNMVTVMGILRDYDVQSTKVTYEVEDHSGRVTCIYWLETEAEGSQTLPAVKVGAYVRVIGTVRLDRERSTRFIMVLKLEAIDNPNELTTFMLETVQVRLEYEALANGPSPANIQANNPGAELATSMSLMNDGPVNPLGLNKLQEKVLNFLRSTTGAVGASKKEVQNNFPPAQHKEVESALTYLGDEGLIYSTTDENHFQVTDSM